jgi:XisI protein
MDTLASYRQLVERILTEYARVPYAHGNVERQTVFDRTQDHYLLMLVGWDGPRRVHGCLVHVDLIDGKVWVQRDGTEYGIARELADAGVPKDHIVLAFRPPEIRKHTEYAVS